jgi:NAD(P)H-dependent flavin oxidoreductase YrpB (nitropropane dioxygenase family)
MDPDFISRLKSFTLDPGGIEWPRFDLSKILWGKMPRMKIGDCSPRLPIIQGGMGVGISLSGLASAVAEAGGIGVIAANGIGMLDADYSACHKDGNSIALRREIRKARAKTAGILGVNIMVAVNDFHALIQVAIEEKVDIVFLGAGLPINGIPVAEMRAAGVKLVPIVSSARAAGLIFKAWEKKYLDIPDGVVVEGPKAGGHLGFKESQIDDPAFALEVILPDVVSVIKPFETRFRRSIPVIAAGGVYTGSDIHKLFQLGARGVQMGTRFVATHECDADIRFKKAYVACREGDIEIIKSPVGMPGRAIKSRFLTEVSSGEKKRIKCSWKCLKSCNIKTAPYCISLALDNARKGFLEKGFAFAGSNAFRIDRILAVRELVQELQDQYRLAEQKGARSLRADYEHALESLGALKKEYITAVRNVFSPLLEEYQKGFESRASMLREESVRAVEKAAKLKADYLNTLTRADRLKNELLEIIERHMSFTAPQPTEA